MIGGVFASGVCQSRVMVQAGCADGAHTRYRCGGRLLLVLVTGRSVRWCSARWVRAFISHKCGDDDAGAVRREDQAIGSSELPVDCAGAVRGGAIDASARTTRTRPAADWLPPNGVDGTCAQMATEMRRLVLLHWTKVLITTLNGQKRLTRAVFGNGTGVTVHQTSAVHITIVFACQLEAMFWSPKWGVNCKLN